MNTAANLGYNKDTICALATPEGTGAIAIVRISGPESFKICEKIFVPLNKDLILSTADSHSIHYGSIVQKSEIIDDVLVFLYHSPNSYTGEDSIEISCHGSPYITQKVIELLINNSARMANAGEFTLRAFLNGKFDLSQAEAVADLIASNSKTSHDLAIKQMRGGFSQKIKVLRQQLIDFSSLLELELDFSEEDVEFADRSDLVELLLNLKTEITGLIDSFSIGNVLKTGIPVAIVGKPNVGKSTLLNVLLNEEKAIVSEIPGTTRDAIEDTIIINGIAFRFIDTAGLHDTNEQLESIGIERTYEKIRQAKIILYMFDISETPLSEIREMIQDCCKDTDDEKKRLILIGNKTDKLIRAPRAFKDLVELETIFISAKRKENITLITDSLLKSVTSENITENTIISNTRHYEALTRALQSINNVEMGFDDGIPTDLLATDIRNALHYIGEITGEITTDEILGNIFGKFCIGK